MPTYKKSDKAQVGLKKKIYRLKIITINSLFSIFMPPRKNCIMLYLLFYKVLFGLI